MTWEVTTDRSIIPLPIVFATCVPRTKAATKLKNAAQATACCGESTRVETTVAIEFAEAVQEVEDQRDEDDGDEDGHVEGTARAQAFLITTLPMMWVKSLQESQASSRFW